MTDHYEIFKDNINRVDNFIRIYERLAKGKGRKGMLDTDVLRAGVVFLHASVENYIRNVIYDLRIKNLNDKDKWKEEIKRLFIGKNSIQIGFDEYWKNKKVLIKTYINNQLICEKETSTFNSYRQIANALKSVGIKVSDEFNKQEQINDYMKRRHKIVHEADRSKKKGRGNHRTEPINVIMINKWVEAAKELVDAIEQSRNDMI